MNKKITLTILGVLAVVLVFVVLFGFVFTGKSINKEQQIKFGVVNSLTGFTSYFGEWTIQGVELAKEDLAKQGKELETVYEDEACDPKKAADAVNRLFNIENVDGLIGPTCGTSLKVAADAAVNANKIGMVVGVNMGEGILKHNYFTTLEPSFKEQRVLAEYAYKNMDSRNVAVIYYNNEWGIDVKANFNKYFQASGGKIVLEEPYTFTDKDFRAILMKVKEKNPDTIFITGGNTEAIVNQMVELGIDAKILSGHGTESQQTIDIAGKNAEGIVYAIGTVPETNDFALRYRAKYGKFPNAFVANAYDETMILYAALEKCHKETNCVRNYIKSVRNYEGASGLLTYDKTIEAFDKPISVKTIREGKFVFL